MSFEITSFFEEKSRQVPYMIEAFGIEIHSRYGKAKEIKEMIDLCEELALTGFDQFVYRLFYDTQSNCMEIEYMEPMGEFYTKPIEKIAANHITQFMCQDGSVNFKNKDLK